MSVSTPHADEKLTLSQLESFLWESADILRDLNIEKILNCFNVYGEINRFSKVIFLKEIRKNDHNLKIRRYADSSPPKENFDFKGILHSGIPIKEIEEESVKEILNGFDMNSLFAKNDNEYMRFKHEIKNKLQIREIIGNKYGNSLKEIDEEIKESEIVMHELLRELGYE